MYPRRSSLRSAAALVIALLLLIACSGGFTSPSALQQGGASSAKPTDTPAKVNSVVINQFKYQPETLTVNAGEVVEWRNEDIVPHSATSVDKKTFDSGRILKGKTWRFTANKKGTFDYFCTLHPNMKAKLVVQ